VAQVAEVDPSPEALKQWFRRKQSGEIKEWWDRLSPKRRERILNARTFNQARILETHFVAGKGGRTGRLINTPRKSEFHIVALDLFLRTGRHEFIYAATAELPSPPQYPKHLKQNYLIDILVPEVDEEPTIPPPRSCNFHAVFQKLRNPGSKEEMQVDRRRPGEREGKEGETL